MAKQESLEWVVTQALSVSVSLSGSLVASRSQQVVLNGILQRAELSDVRRNLFELSSAMLSVWKVSALVLLLDCWRRRFAQKRKEFSQAASESLSQPLIR